MIAGDPLLSTKTSAARAVVQTAALSSPASYIPETTIAAIDARVTGQCDAIDGAKMHRTLGVPGPRRGPTLPRR